MAGISRSAALAYLLALGVAAPAASAAAASAPSFEGNAVEWRPLTPLPAPLSDFSATLLAATAAGEPDEIAITGGCAAAQELLCLEGDASCFFVCPSATNTTLMYDPAADAWREGAPAPRLRLRHAAAAALGGELMVVLGGRDADDAIVRAVDVYNATADAWMTPLSNWTGAASDWGAFAIEAWPTLGAATVVAVGGYDAGYTSLAAAQTLVVAPDGQFDAALPAGTEVLQRSEAFAFAGGPPLRLAWVEMPAGAGGVPDLPTDRGDVTVVPPAPASEGVEAIVTVIGGYHSGNFCSPLSTVEAMVVPHPEGLAGGNASESNASMALSWVALPSMAHPRADAAGGWVAGRLFVAGGEGAKPCSDFSVALDQVEEWVPPAGGVAAVLASQSGAPLAPWRDAGAFPEHRWRFAGASTATALYLFGGQRAFDAALSTYPLSDHTHAFSEGCPSAPASGDVNGDGKLTIADVAAALLHQQSLQGTGQAPPCALAAADLDADGELGGADVEALRKLVVGE